MIVMLVMIVMMKVDVDICWRCIQRVRLNRGFVGV